MNIKELKELEITAPPKKLVDFLEYYIINGWPRWLPYPDIQPVGYDAVQLKVTDELSVEIKII